MYIKFNGDKFNELIDDIKSTLESKGYPLPLILKNYNIPEEYIFPDDDGEFKQFLKDFPEFKDIVKFMLNEEQEKAVTYDNEKFLSIQAGPGSGKTRVLIEKVSYMVNKLGVEPESFLIITFSNDTADELKDRLIDEDIPASEVQKMQISTIHSFCLKILEETGNVGLDVIAEGEKQELFIKKHLEYLGFTKEAYAGNYDIPIIIKKYNEFSTFKVKCDELIDYIENNFPVDECYVDYVHKYMEKHDGNFPSDEIKAIDIKNKNKVCRDNYNHAKFLQIAKSYKNYLSLLEKENAIDYPQMQIKALEKMQEGYLPSYTNILIDEFQDTDPVQMEIFKIFIDNDKTESFTVVGDSNQSIYGFRGSNKNYFKELMDEYSDKFIEMFLKTNYRSTEEIIDMSQDFISKHYESKDDLRDAICGREEFEKNPHNDVYFMVSEDNESEAKNILKLIKHIKTDEGPVKHYSDIGILMRSVKAKSACFIEHLKGLFDKEGIPYDVKSTGDLADCWELKYIFTLMYHLIQEDDPYYTYVPPEVGEWLNLNTLTGENGNEPLVRLSSETNDILNELQNKFNKDIETVDKMVCKDKGWGNGVQTYNGIYNGKTRERQEEVFSRIKKPILSDENLIEYGVNDSKDLEFFHKLNELKKEVNAEDYFDRPTVSEVYFRLLTDITGYLNQDLVNKNEAMVLNLALINSSFINYEEVMYERGLRGAFYFIKRVFKNFDSNKEKQDAVKIMTVHKSKGLEFPVVILASIRNDGFPLDFKKPDKNDKYWGKFQYTIPDNCLEYDKYEFDDAEQSHIQEEERGLYVAKTRAKDELILSIISENSSEDVENALNDYTDENIKAINKGPERIQEVIDDNLEYTKLIDPNNIEMKILNVKDREPEEEIVNLSFTALQNFKECPMKFKLSDMFKFKVSQKKEIDAGIFIHRALEIINKKILANNNEYIGDDEVRCSVEQLFKKANLRLKEEKPEMYNDHLTSITADVLEYYNTVGNNLTMLESEYAFYLKEKDYVFTGKIDLIYEKDGELGIIDYKNTSLVSKEYLEKYRKQLHLYIMALRDENHEYHGHKIEKLNIYAIKYKKGDKLMPFEVDEEYILELKHELEDTALQIKNGNFEVGCEDCGDCPYKKICKK